MSDKKLMILSTLEDIEFSIELILQRFEVIESSDDFYSFPSLLRGNAYES